MGDVETARALLVMALQDLLDGEAALVERLSEVESNARDEDFAALIGQDRTRSAAQRQEVLAILDTLGEGAGDSPNIWLRAILDDAANDAETIAAGPLRDTALVGALRKGKQSERVSYETALALARQQQLPGAAQTLQRIRDEEQAADDALAAVLRKLTSAQ